ncbi:MAG: MFS transporter [Halopseudomonas sp.]|uniref:MFS transporter n=1 Tax=Halopseudomonas sp. TaxID=2901191 RepID=UPI003002E2A9
MVWQLALMLWVGGVWSAHFVLLPALTHIGLAPLLVDDVSGVLRPIMLGFAAVCACLQLLVLLGYEGRRFWRDLRGQLLLVVLVAVACYSLVASLPQGLFLSLFCYLVVAFAGLVLIFQPRPDEGR